MLLALLLLATPHMTYHGGKVLPAPRYYNLYWGFYWQDHPDQRQWFDQFTAAVAPSKELASQVTEYSVNGQQLGAGSFGGSIVALENPAPEITSHDLVEFIHRQLQANAVPQPDEHNVYAVFLAPGVKITDESKAVGYHGPTAYGFHQIMIHFDSYVLDVASRDVAAVTYSHEMAETVTDPDLDAWYSDDDGSEVGDVCQGKVGFAGGYTIQMEWSNASNACMASRDVPIPPSGGQCPMGTHLDGGSCVGDIWNFGCSSTAAGWPALLGLAVLALRFRTRRPRTGH